MWTLKTQFALAIALSIALAGGTWWVHSRGVQSGKTQVQALWDAESAQVAQAQAVEIAKAMATAAALQSHVDQLQRRHQNEIARIGRRHAAALDGLRDRPEARADLGGVSADPGAAPAGGTGAGLARPDAAFLVGYAADAARIAEALDLCVTAYEAARMQRGSVAD